MNHEALIVGGGLAGSALALRLAQAGRSVVLLERSRGPEHKMCGEFFSGEALHYLHALGVDPAALGALPIRGMRLVSGEILAETALPFPALSLTRRRLDQAMLERAAEAGAQVLRGERVQALEEEPSGWTARRETSAPIHASAAFLATGKHDLGGWKRRAGWHNGLVAFKMYFQLTPQQHQALGSNIELILFPGGYAGLQPVEDGAVNLCLLVTRSRLQRAQSQWQTLLAHLTETSPHLAGRLAGAIPALARPLALSSIPYGLLPKQSPDQLWRVGDQAAVMPSFSGDGMSIALHSAELAARMYLEGSNPSAYSARLAGELRPGVSLATALSHLLVRLPVAARLAKGSAALLRELAVATRIPEHALLR